MKKTIMLIVLCVVLATVMLSIAMAVAYSVQSLTILPFNLESWQSWVLIASVYVCLCGIMRGSYEWICAIKDMDEE